jgi:hypothetical protein
LPESVIESRRRLAGKPPVSVTGECRFNSGLLDLAKHAFVAQTGLSGCLRSSRVQVRILPEALAESLQRMGRKSTPPKLSLELEHLLAKQKDAGSNPAGGACNDESPSTFCRVGGGFAEPTNGSGRFRKAFTHPTKGGRTSVRILPEALANEAMPSKLSWTEHLFPKQKGAGSNPAEGTEQRSRRLAVEDVSVTGRRSVVRFHPGSLDRSGRLMADEVSGVVVQHATL